MKSEENVVGAVTDSDGFYESWMRVACAQSQSLVAHDKTPPVTRHTSHTPEERRKLHPSVVSRLRLAQRFSRRELKDVPHA